MEGVEKVVTVAIIAGLLLCVAGFFYDYKSTQLHLAMGQCKVGNAWQLCK